MEQIEGSETLYENGAASKLGQIENHGDKILGAVARDYDSRLNSNEPASNSSSLAATCGYDFDFEKIGIRDCSMKFFSPRIDSQKGFEVVKNIAEEVQVKGVENAPQMKTSDGEVSENGISLFVEVFGPPNGSIGRNEAVRREYIGSGRCVNNDVIGENGGSSNDKKGNPILKDLGKEEEATLGDKHKLIVGDLVWVRTKIKSWWPGQIIDPSHVCNVAPKSDRKATFLVNYFGKNPSVWCSPKQLKPFAENFEQVSSQGKSNVFFNAVEKAVDEFGRRMKARMTCFCGNGAMKDATHFLDKSVLHQFETVNFLYLVRNLAWDESKTGMLELAKIRTHLSVFYRYLGHHQLPMNELHDMTDNGAQSSKRRKNSRLNDENKSEQGFELRDRRRSKYLSYPYIDLNQPCINLPVLEKDATNEVAVYNGLAGQPSSSLRKVNSTYQPKAPITPGDLNTPLVDLISKLRFAAVGCVFPIEESGFHLVDRFFYGFRRWVFHDKYDPEIEHKQENVEKSKDGFKSQGPVGDKPLTSNSNPIITFNRKRRKKHEIFAPNLNAKSAPSSGVFDVNGTGGSSVINFEVPGSNEPRSSSEPMKSTKRATNVPVPKLVECEITVLLPDLNGNCNKQIPLAETSQANYFTTPVNRPVQNKVMKKVGPLSGCSGAKIAGDMNINYAEYGSYVTNVKSTNPCSAEHGVDLNDHERMNNEASYGRSNNDGNKLKESSLVMGLLVPGHNKPQPMKRQRKEKTTKAEARAWLASPMADLNGNANVSASSSQGKVLPEMHSAPVEVKTLKKRGRKKKIISPQTNLNPCFSKYPQTNLNPCFLKYPQTNLNPCFSKVHINGELSGTALILAFAQGFAVPSKEALIATFCGFGPLNASETKGLSDNRSAQVVFTNGSDAVEALKGIQKSSPFGPNLIKCQLRHLSPAPRPIEFIPCELKVNKTKERPDLAFIKKNLEMMTSVLETGGDNLSAEMRAKLENEVKGLLKKVNTMVGSTSSS